MSFFFSIVWNVVIASLLVRAFDNPVFRFCEKVEWERRRGCNPGKKKRHRVIKKNRGRKHGRKMLALRKIPESCTKTTRKGEDSWKWRFRVGIAYISRNFDWRFRFFFFASFSACISCGGSYLGEVFARSHIIFKNLISRHFRGILNCFREKSRGDTWSIWQPSCRIRPSLLPVAHFVKSAEQQGTKVEGSAVQICPGLKNHQILSAATHMTFHPGTAIILPGIYFSIPGKLDIAETSLIFNILITGFLSGSTHFRSSPFFPSAFNVC